MNVIRKFQLTQNIYIYIFLMIFNTLVCKLNVVKFVMFKKVNKYTIDTFPNIP